LNIWGIFLLGISPISIAVSRVFFGVGNGKQKGRRED
jgi:hypothetical protein